MRMRALFGFAVCGAAITSFVASRAAGDGGVHLDVPAVVAPQGGARSDSLDAGPPSGEAWFLQAVLTPADGGTVAASDVGGFGRAVALSGPLAVVGAPWTLPSAPSDAGVRCTQGAAFVFAQSGTAWSQVAALTADDGTPGDYFGASVAISGSTVIVGAPVVDCAGTRPGAAYVFSRSGSAWAKQKLTATDGRPGDRFGSSVSISGGVALVGATGAGAAGSSGAVYVFALDGATWVPVQTLTGDPGDPPEPMFGAAVAVSGGTAFVSGSYQASDAPDAGAAWTHVFEEDDAGAWTPRQLLPSCLTVALAPGLAAAVSFDSSGEVTLFAEDGGTWASQTTLTTSETYNFALAVCPGGVVLAGQGSLAGVEISHYALQGDAWVFEPQEWQGVVPFFDAYETSVAIGEGATLIGQPAPLPDPSNGTGLVYVEFPGPANGTACVTGGDCGSGICVAGVCCNTPCDGGCERCATGACIPLDGGSAGGCTHWLCDGTHGTCPTTCQLDPDCAPGNYCAAGSCTTLLGTGAPCATPHECASGACPKGVCLGTAPSAATCARGVECASSFCVDGVCCDSPCDGQCEACDVQGAPGSCSPVVGTPHGDRTCVGAGTTCAGTCAGSASASGCVYPTTPCGSSCADGHQTDRVCNGQGQCVAGVPYACNNLACEDATRCKSSCATYEDCVAGFTCADGGCQPGGSVCVGGHALKDVSIPGDAGITDCAPYVCDPVSSRCKQACVTVADCAFPEVCDPTVGKCVAPPSPPSATVAAFGCPQAPGDAPRSTVLWFFAGAIAGRARRRRRGRAAPLAP